MVIRKGTYDRLTIQTIMSTSTSEKGEPEGTSFTSLSVGAAPQKEAEQEAILQYQQEAMADYIKDLQEEVDDIHEQLRTVLNAEAKVQQMPELLDGPIHKHVQGELEYLHDKLQLAIKQLHKAREQPGTVKEQTNYQKVVEFNKKFGVTVFDKPQLDIFDKDPASIKLGMDLIREEMRELEEGVKNKDYVEVIDAIGDILVVVNGLAARIGCDADVCMGLVHESNMSKLCKSEDEATNTVTWYKEQFEQKKLPYDSAGYKRSDDGKYWVVYNQSSGKILKSINYSPVNFSSMFK